MKQWNARTIATQLFGAVCITLGSALAVAQTAAPQATQPAAPTTQAKAPVLKPEMTMNDVAFSIDILNSITINGREVEAFLEVKNTLIAVFEKAQKDKKQAADKLTLELNQTVASNLIQLMDRATVSGSRAEVFQGIKTSIFASAQAYNQSQQNTSKR